jgi:hypothetical protein
MLRGPISFRLYLWTVAAVIAVVLAAGVVVEHV